MTLICVTLSDPNDWRDHTALLDWGFSRVRRTELPGPWTVAVTGGEGESVTVSPGESPAVCVLEEELPRITWSVELPPFLYAPVEPGQPVGTARCLLDGREYAAIPLIAENAAAAREIPEPSSLWERLCRWIAGIFHKES